MKPNYRLLVFALAMIAQVSITKAQTTSVMGRFSVQNVTGCAPFEVDITELDNFGSSTTRQYWYEDKSGVPTTDKNFTYNTPGEYYLVQLVGANVPQKEDSLKITVYDPAPPEFEIHNCAGHTIRVEITDTNYDRYRVNFTATNSEVIGPGITSSEFDFGTAGDYPITVTGLYNNAVNNCGTNTKTITTIDNIVTPILHSVEVNTESSDGSTLLTYTIGEESVYVLEVSENDIVGFYDLYEITGNRENVTGINTLGNYYCYRIRTFDACSNVYIYSNIVCSTSINVKVDNGVNLVSWKTASGIPSSYKVIRNGEVQTEINDTFASSFDDDNILCGNDYCYEIQAIFNSGSSLSIDTCVVASKTGDLPALSTPSSTIFNEGVVLNWEKPIEDIQLSQYMIQRSANGKAFSTISRTLDTTYIDNSNSPFRQTLKYRILYQDNCGNTSIPSPITAPIILQVKSVNGNAVVLEWNKYETWGNGIRTYFIERLDDSGAIMEEFSVLSGRTKEITFSTDDDQPKNLRVRAESLDQTPLISYSNIRTVVINPLVNFPNAFTPDGDGLNDDFKPIGTKVFNFKMQIFSRWGNVIFYTEDMNLGWDGRINGKNALEGTYTYRVNYEDATGRSFDKAGSIVLIRDNNN
ncbi:gliding motility-associated C-terminal domain-containing protein [Reichenbachiella sp. MALMAid0571]|uniref:gliding motility-associated C-terminal domain-containing protein n=1 Tax=Reichenbachiella sp. MALMAid0571 TaxID=3143939 RepID=UPI0032E03763